MSYLGLFLWMNSEVLECKLFMSSCPHRSTVTQRTINKDFTWSEVSWEASHPVSLRLSKQLFSRADECLSLSFCSRLTQSASQSTDIKSISTPHPSFMGSSSLTCMFVSRIAPSPGFPTPKLRVCEVTLSAYPHHLNHHTHHPLYHIQLSQGSLRCCPWWCTCLLIYLENSMFLHQLPKPQTAD